MRYAYCALQAGVFHFAELIGLICPEEIKGVSSAEFVDARILCETKGVMKMAAARKDDQLLKLKDNRKSFATEELPDEEVEAIVSQRMDPRHDHLNTLLDPE